MLRKLGDRALNVDDLLGATYCVTQTWLRDQKPTASTPLSIYPSSTRLSSAVSRRKENDWFLCETENNSLHFSVLILISLTLVFMVYLNISPCLCRNVRIEVLEWVWSGVLGPSVPALSSHVSYVSLLWQPNLVRNITNEIINSPS